MPSDSTSEADPTPGRVPPADTTSPRRVEVPAARMPGWLDRLGQAHGGLTATLSADAHLVQVRAGDGLQAELTVPFGPLRPGPLDPLAALLDHLARPRRVGLLLVRRGGFAAGVVQSGVLAEARVGTRHVQGRTAAGGWSQKRFARRRLKQTDELCAAATELAVQVLGAATGLDAVLTGGDRRLLAAVLEDRRLARLRPLVAARVLDVADPRRRVLEAAAARCDAVLATLTEQTEDSTR